MIETDGISAFKLAASLAFGGALFMIWTRSVNNFITWLVERFNIKDETAVDLYSALHQRQIVMLVVCVCGIAFYSFISSIPARWDALLAFVGGL